MEYYNGSSFALLRRLLCRRRRGHSLRKWIQPNNCQLSIDFYCNSVSCLVCSDTTSKSCLCLLNNLEQRCRQSVIAIIWTQTRTTNWIKTVRIWATLVFHCKIDSNCPPNWTGHFHVSFSWFHLFAIITIFYFPKMNSHSHSFSI